MFHSVFCRSVRRSTGQEVANWFMDSEQFDEIPQFKPPFDSDVLRSPDWRVLDAFYDEGKRPIRICRADGRECELLVNEAITELIDRGGGAENNAALIESLRATKQAYSIELDENGLSDDGWETLDVFEARLAQELEGITYSVDEGFVDGHNRPLVAFP